MRWGAFRIHCPKPKGAFTKGILKMSCVPCCLQLLSVLLQLPHPNSFGLSWRGGTLQGTKMTSWVFARSYFGQLLCIIRSVCDKAEKKKRKLYIKTTKHPCSSASRMLSHILNVMFFQASPFPSVPACNSWD